MFSSKRYSVTSRYVFYGTILIMLACANMMTFSVLWVVLNDWPVTTPVAQAAEQARFDEPQAIIAPTYMPLPPKKVVTPTVEPTATMPEPTSTVMGTQVPTPTESLTENISIITMSTVILTPIPWDTPTPEVVGTKYVIVISIDGLRPDALDLAYTPHLDKLRENGAYCPNAQTLPLSITLPSHASMLSGMIPEKHGIQWGLPYIGWPGMTGPTVFNVAHEAGLRTGMVFGKEKLNYLIVGEPVDTLFGQDAHDPEIKEATLTVIEEGLPHVLFVHFPDTDRVGHAYGWMSENQIYSITFVDGLIGEIVTALESHGYWPNTMLIITADHGGHGFSHGDDTPLDRTIPWLAVGPDVPANLTIERPINTYDTAPTVLHVLGLPRPEQWDGQPVWEVFP